MFKMRLSGKALLLIFMAVCGPDECRASDQRPQPERASPSRASRAIPSVPGDAERRTGSVLPADS